jgi:hypothetical protein
MIQAVAFVVFVVLAVAAVTLLGPILGAVAWLACFGFVLALNALVRHLTNPEHLAIERATRPGSSSPPATAGKRRRRPTSQSATPF